MEKWQFYEIFQRHIIQFTIIVIIAAILSQDAFFRHDFIFKTFYHNQRQKGISVSQFWQGLIISWNPLSPEVATLSTLVANRMKKSTINLLFIEYNRGKKHCDNSY